MDNGNITEFDAPDVLHGKNGIFRTMCEHSSTMLKNIHRVREEGTARSRGHGSGVGEVGIVGSSAAMVLKYPLQNPLQI